MNLVSSGMNSYLFAYIRDASTIFKLFRIISRIFNFSSGILSKLSYSSINSFNSLRSRISWSCFDALGMLNISIVCVVKFRTHWNLMFHLNFRSASSTVR